MISTTAPISIGKKTKTQLLAEAKAELLDASAGFGDYEVRKLASTGEPERISEITKEATLESVVEFGEIVSTAESRWDYDIIAESALAQYAKENGESLQIRLASAGQHALERSENAGDFYAKALLKNVEDDGVKAVLEVALEHDNKSEQSLSTAFRVAASGTGGPIGQALAAAYEEGSAKPLFIRALAQHKEWYDIRSLMAKNPKALVDGDEFTRVAFLERPEHRFALGLAAVATMEPDRDSSNLLHTFLKKYAEDADMPDVDNSTSNRGGPKKAKKLLDRLGVTAQEVLDSSRSGEKLPIDWSTKAKAPESFARMHKELSELDQKKLKAKGLISKRLARKERAKAEKLVAEAKKLIAQVGTTALLEVYKNVLETPEASLADQVKRLSSVLNISNGDRLRVYRDLFNYEKVDLGRDDIDKALKSLVKTEDPKLVAAGKVGQMIRKGQHSSYTLFEVHDLLIQTRELPTEKSAAAFMSFFHSEDDKARDYIASLMDKDERELYKSLHSDDSLTYRAHAGLAAGHRLTPKLIQRLKRLSRLPHKPNDLVDHVEEKLGKGSFEELSPQVHGLRPVHNAVSTVS